MLSFSLSLHNNLPLYIFSAEEIRGDIELNLFNNFMSLKISRKPSFPRGTKRATKRTSNLNKSRTWRHQLKTQYTNPKTNLYNKQVRFTCEETQAVRRVIPFSSSCTGIPTVSINRLSSSFSSNCKIKQQKIKTLDNSKH